MHSFIYVDQVIDCELTAPYIIPCDFYYWVALHIILYDIYFGY